MTADTSSPPATPHRIRPIAAGVALAAVALLAIAFGHRIAAEGRDPWAGWLAAAVAVGGAGLAAWWSRWDRPVLVGAGGALVALLGSGVGRPFGDERYPGSGGGDVVVAAAVWWPVVVVGLAVVVGAVVWAAQNPSMPGGRAHRASAPVGNDRAVSSRRASGLAVVVTEAFGLALIAVTMGDVVVGSWIEGRPRRHRGRLVRRDRFPGTASGRAPAPSGAAGSVGAVWADAARDEAEAVAAFAELAARLEAAGAPADLVERARRASGDEVRHVRTCRRLAVAPLGSGPLVVAGDRSDRRARPVRRARPAPPGSGPLPGRSAGTPGAGPSSRAGAGRGPGRRTVELVRLAVESYVDGVVGEGAAAGRLERGAVTAPERAVALREMAADERDHAALGADVVRWCAAEAPRLVPAAVRAAARRMSDRTELPPGHGAHDDASLRAAGLVDRAGATTVWCVERDRALAALDDLLADRP